MTVLDAIARRYKGASEVRNCAVDFSRKLDVGESLTGTPTVTISPTGPTLSDKAVNTSALTINGDVVPIGSAVQFKVTGGTAGVYTITATCGTTATPAQTLEVRCSLEIV